MLGMDLVFGANTKNNPGSNRIYSERSERREATLASEL